MQDHEFAFDIKMFAVVRVVAGSRAEAESALASGLDCVSLNIQIATAKGTLALTEASVYVDDESYPYLFEIDGEPADNDELPF